MVLVKDLTFEVDIAEELILANNECDSNFYEDITEKIKEFDEKVNIRVHKKAVEFWNLNEKKLFKVMKQIF